MNKLIGIVLGLVALQLVAGEEQTWLGPKVVFDKGYYGCGARISGKNVEPGQPLPPVTLQLVACSLTNWNDQKVYTVQQGDHADFNRTVRCEQNFYIDDTFAVFQDKLKYFDQNTIEVQDFTFHCNNGQQFSTLGVTEEFKKWELYDYFFTKGFQIEINRQIGYFESYKHVDLVIFYKELSQLEIQDYEKILKGQGEVVEPQAPVKEDGKCGEGLVLLEGQCQKVCEVGQVNDHGECREACSIKTDVILEGRCIAECPIGWAVEDGVCVAECGYGRKGIFYSKEGYSNLVGASRRQHKSYKKVSKKMRRNIRK